MNNVSPKKLLNSKWTASTPKNKEKHFVIIEVEKNEDGEVLSCTMEAVMSKREFTVDWHDLKNAEVWHQGWK